MAKFTLLLVDDEPNILRALARDLQDTDWRILMVQSGVEGLERLADNEVDLVISDQRMPGMTGGGQGFWLQRSASVIGDWRPGAFEY